MVNIAICDDTADYGEILQYKISQYMLEHNIEYQLYYFDNLEDFQEKASEVSIDILFLDIMINSVNSAQWVANHKISKDLQIIYMTSYPEEAYSISETEFTYFIVKSHLKEDMLASALSKAINKISKKDPNLTAIKCGSKSYTVNLQNIIYIETFNNNISLHMKGGQSISLYIPLSRFSKKLPPYFLQCHKSFMVNMNHITSFEPHKFTLCSEYNVPIPVKKYKYVIQKYLDYIKNI